MFKKVIAGIASVTLALGMVALTAGPASADKPEPPPIVGVEGTLVQWTEDTNHAEYWEEQGVTCYKDDATYGSITDGGLTVTLNAGFTFTKLIVKGGNLWNNVITNPVPGTAYASTVNAGGQQAAVSHWIVCLTTPPPPPPGVVDSQCTEQYVPSTPTYTIPDIDGVQYQVKVDDGPWTDVSAGSHNAIPGSTYDFQAFAPGLTEFDSHKFPIVDCIGDVEIIGDPIFTDAYCQRDGNVPVAGTYEVIAALHVNYTVSVNDGAEVPIAVGVHPANPGDKVEIWAHADLGWELDEEATSYWVHTFGAAVDCSLTPPVLSCLLADEEGIITLPLIAHVKWIVNGAPAASGPILVQLSILDTDIQAVADPGYIFSAGDTSWTFGLDDEGECGIPTLAFIKTNVTHTDQVCREGVKGGSTVTVGQVDGDSFFDEVNYYLDGSATPLSSVTTQVAPGNHTVTASPKDPDDGLDGESEWEFTVLAAPASCDLTTLALTGAGANPVGWAGLGYYLLIAGLGLIAVRTVRRRNEVSR